MSHSASARYSLVTSTTGRVQYDTLPGYEDVADKKHLPPSIPCLEDVRAPSGRLKDALDFLHMFPLTRDEALEVLRGEIRKHRTWRKSALKHVSVTDVHPTYALQYTVETFYEARTTCYASEPFIGQYVDYASGIPPSAWDIETNPGENFRPEKRIMEVPSSAKIVVCQACSGNGSSHCFFCHGTGSEHCSVCNGTGMKHCIPHPSQAFAQPGVYGPGAAFGFTPSTYGAPPRSSLGRQTSLGAGHSTGQPWQPRLPPPGVPTSELCVFCHGIGSKACSHCKGTGQRSCPHCGSSGSIKTFIRLTVLFDVEKDEYIHDSGDIPHSLLVEADGEIVFEEEKELIRPIASSVCSELEKRSKQLIAKQREACATNYAHIRQQRHTLRAIPVTVVSFSYKQKQNRQFSIFGKEKRVFMHEYPSKCSIL